MAIATVNEKLAVMEWCNPMEPGLPINPGVIGQDDKQQFLWDYPGVLWNPPTSGFAPGGFLVNITRLRTR